MGLDLLSLGESMAGAGLSGFLGGNAAKDAADTQAKAQQYATNTQLNMFQDTQTHLRPYRQAGENAIGDIMGGLGLPGGTTNGVTGGQFTHQFGAEDLNANMAPGYQFALDQGNRATTNLANVSGGAFSGNTLKAISDYNIGTAQQGYQQAFENYNTNQQNIYNRLSNIAGLGESASANSASGASTFAGGIGSSIAAQGAAQASGQVGQANAYTGALNNATSWYQLNNLLKPSAGAGGSGVDFMAGNDMITGGEPQFQYGNG